MLGCQARASMGYRCRCALEWARGIGLLDAVGYSRRTQRVGISNYGPAYGRLATAKLTKRHRGFCAAVFGQLSVAYSSWQYMRKCTHKALQMGATANHDED
jgi:hypothetical protein